MWFCKDKNKVKVEEPKKTFTNMLTIDMEDGATIRNWVSDWDTSKDKIIPWKDFYKWYFGRKTDEWMMRSKDSEMLVKRKDIKSFCLKVKEEL